MEDNKSNKRMYKDRVTIYEVAKVAGVSLATVSRVINGHTNVTEKTKKAVEDAIARLGYKPSALAQGLANSRSTHLGIMIPSTGYSYVSNMLDGMIDMAKIYGGYITSIFVTRRNKEDAAQMIESLIKSHVDGAVIYDDLLGTDEIRSIQNYHIPLIVIGHDMEGDALGSINLEFKDPILDVVKEHLMTGADDITVLDIVNQGKMVDDIRDGILEYGQANGKHIQTLQFNDSYGIVYAGMKEYFRTHKSGYFVAPRDSLGAAILNAALESGLRVPKDVEILAEIGGKYSYIVRPQISSFSMDMFKVGSIAVRMLTKLLNEPDKIKQKTFKMRATYNKRETTK